MAFDDTKNEHSGGNGNGKAKSRGKKAAAGRKDHEGQEAVLDVTALKKFMPKAIKWEKEDMDRASDKSEFYKKGGTETGFNVAQLKAAAKAYAKEEVEAAKRKAEQSTLIFEECG
jgi:hypothetical protein